MEKHNVCTGTCGGVSDEPKACGAEDCPKHGQILKPCDCQDSRHNGKQDQGTEEEPQDKE